MLIKSLCYNIIGFSAVFLLNGAAPPITVLLMAAALITLLFLLAPRHTGRSLWRWPRSGPTNYIPY